MSETLQHGTAPPRRPAPPPASLPLRGHVLRLPAGPPPGLAPALAVVRDHVARLGARTVTAASDGDEDSVRLRLGGRGEGLALRLSGWGGLLAGHETWGPFQETTGQAATGLMTVHGRACGGPRPLGVDYLGTVGGVAATTALLATALGQARGIDVRRAELALAHTALFTLGQYLAAATADEEPEDDDEPTRPWTPGEQPPFVSADGIRFEVEALEAGPWQAFWHQLGVPARQIAESWGPYLGRYARATCPVSPALAEAAALHPYCEVLRIAEITGMSVSPVRGLGHRSADEDVVHDHAPWTVTHEGTTSPTATDAPSGTGLPLAGLRVVESTRRIQGPLAGLLLGALGAEVIRIEPPGGDPLRGVPPMAGDASARFVMLNRGKEIHEIDFRTSKGRRHLLDLVGGADVFLHNWAPGKAAQLGLERPDLAAVSPGIVYAWASAWGRDAPAARLPLGTDFMVQAWSGVADAVRTSGRPPAPSLVTLLDLLGGYVAAEAVVAGLLARQHGAAGVRVDSSLLGASRVLLGPRLRCAAPAHPTGFTTATSDGLLAVAADRTTVKAAGVPLDTNTNTHTNTSTNTNTDTDTHADSTAHLHARLAAAGVPSAPVRTDLRSLPADPTLGQVFTHRGCALVTPPWRFS
ncbi:CoA transferase [Streptomyces antibioticus]|uniref:CoA transferase n=1 Tax=Streptomyces antibioticus TaxID=1890 RepID=UPI0033A6114B